MGWLSGIFGDIWGYVGAAALAALIAGWGVHRIDDAAYADLQLAHQKAATAAVQQAADAQKRQDDVALNAAVAEAKAQQQIVTQTHTITKEITVHVPDTVPCVPAGFVRMLDTAAGVGQDASGIAASQSDDACAPLSWRELATQLADDYGTGRQNSEQLNALEDAVRQMVKAANQ